MAYSKYYSYLVTTVPPAVYSQDAPYTLYNGHVVWNVTIAESVQRYFTNFAEAGDPNEPAVQSFGVYRLGTISLEFIVSFISMVLADRENERFEWRQRELVIARTLNT